MKRTRKVFSNEFKRKILRRIDSGELQKDVAAELGTSSTVITKWRSQLGVIQKKDHKTRVCYPLSFKREILKRWDNGENVNALSEEIGVHPTTIPHWRLQVSFADANPDAVLSKTLSLKPEEERVKQPTFDLLPLQRHCTECSQKDEVIRQLKNTMKYIQKCVAYVDAATREGIGDD